MTATGSEFGRWYTLTGGVRGPVIYTSLSQHATIAALGVQLTAAMGKDPATPRPLPWPEMAGEQALLLIGQIMRQLPLLWILDDLGHMPDPSSQTSDQAPAGRQELLRLLRSARDTKAKLLLISRQDEQA